jgi:endoglucanase
MKALGCDHVRLPVEFFSAAGPAPDFKIDPMLLMFIDEVTDWAEELEMYLIIDNHSFSDKVKTKPEVVDTLLAVWLQVADHFKNRSDFIVYEVLNEPHGIVDDVWNGIQQQTINAIRTVDKKHTIIVGPAEWYNYNHLYQMPEYSDTNLVYTFHFYDPFLFTTALDIVIPYPYDSGRMPDMPVYWAGEWYEELSNEYPLQGNDEYLYRLIDTAINFREIRNVPVYCGEFGVNMMNCEEEDRVYWISTVRTYLEEHNIPWTMWSYNDYMGIFDPATPQLFEYNMDTSVVKALGLKPPAQKEFRILPDSTGFFLYDDYIPQYIVENSWITGGSTQYF